MPSLHKLQPIRIWSFAILIGNDVDNVSRVERGVEVSHHVIDLRRGAFVSNL